MEQKRKYWNMETEPILNTTEIREIQIQKMKSLVKRLYENKPFWRDYLNKAKVKPEHIKSIDDFRKRIPIFDKAKRRQLAEDCDMDMIQVVDKTIGVPLDDLCLMAATTGTTGEPTPYPHTINDIKWLSEIAARMLWRIGVRPEDRIIHAFGMSMFIAGVPYATYFQKSGACVLPVGAEGGVEKILRIAKLFKGTVLAGTPSLAEHLIEKAPEIIGCDVKSLSIDKLFCAGEPGAGIPEVRKKLESAYGGKVFDHGGTWGVSCDYPEYQGMHHVSDDYMFFELVDPKTLEPLPFEDGVQGLSVQTTLQGEGLMWLRESVGDIWQIFTEPCPCGGTGFRCRHVGRTDDMLKVKGVIVYPAAIDNVISRFSPKVTGEFRIVLDEPPPRVVPPLQLKIEYGEGLSPEELVDLKSSMNEEMHLKLKIRPKIDWLPPKTLKRSTYKTSFIEKNYEKK
jgi:phenylacetate-CoA ligase